MCDRKGVIYKGRTDLTMEVGARRRDRRARSGGRLRRRRRVPRPVGSGRAQARDGQDHGQAADHLRHGQSRSGDQSAGCDRGSARCDHRDRPLGLPNQVNNVLGFPFIFRGALDVRATAINEEMKIAAAEALGRTRARAGAGGSRGGLWRAPQLWPRLFIPAPFDPRLMEVVASAVAEAAMRTGVAQKPIEDIDAYRE